MLPNVTPWAAILRQIQGEWIEVEPHHLFKDQFNTVALPVERGLHLTGGFLPHGGLRLMADDVAEIEDDLRLHCQLVTGKGPIRPTEEEMITARAEEETPS